MITWRLITDDDVTASFGLAADELLTRWVGSDQAQPTLRLYTYHPHCALVGRFQRIESELRVDYCREHSIPINRRPTGGGAILMGAGPLGVALMLPGSGDHVYRRARDLMAQVSEGLLFGLGRLGIQAEFRRKNDIEVHGRKIAGVGIYRAPTDGLLFHASVLVDLDVPLMLQVLNIPVEKISDKEIAAVSARTSTVRGEFGRAISVDEVRQAIAAGYVDAFGVTLEPGDFTPAERSAITALERDKYLTDEWIYQTTAVPDSAASARLKTPGGLLDIRVALAGQIIKSVFIGGDFFAADNAIADLEARLRWHVADPAAIATTLRQTYERWPIELESIPLDGLTEVVLTAVQRAVEAQA
jgi:lipoate-protein ligase A